MKTNIRIERDVVHKPVIHMPFMLVQSLQQYATRNSLGQTVLLLQCMFAGDFQHLPDEEALAIVKNVCALRYVAHYISGGSDMTVISLETDIT